MKHNWEGATTKIIDKYNKKCRLFVDDDKAFSNFKRDPDFCKILESNGREVGAIALRSIIDKGGYQFLFEHLDEFKENESIGNPHKEAYWEGDEVAPSTLRYVNSLVEIKLLLGEDKPKRIIEIGGGYGGLCKIFSSVYDFDSYTLVDMPDVIALCDKYLSNFPIHPKVKYVSSNDMFEIIDDYDLFIADSSLAECNQETQMVYGKIAQRCKYVYIIYNTFHKPNGPQIFTKFLMHLLFTHPLTHFNFDYEGISNVAILSLKRYK